MRATPTRRMAVSMAKAAASDAGRKVCAAGIQLHGGIGMTWEHDLQLYLKRAKADEVALGDATWHRERIARPAGRMGAAWTVGVPHERPALLALAAVLALTAAPRAACAAYEPPRRPLRHLGPPLCGQSDRPLTSAPGRQRRTSAAATSTAAAIPALTAGWSPDTDAARQRSPR